MALRNRYNPSFQIPYWVGGLRTPVTELVQNLPRGSGAMEEWLALSVGDSNIASELQEMLDAIDALIASEQPETERPPPTMANTITAASRVGQSPLTLKRPKIFGAMSRIRDAPQGAVAWMQTWMNANHGRTSMFDVWLAALYLLTCKTLLGDRLIT